MIFAVLFWKYRLRLFFWQKLTPYSYCIIHMLREVLLNLVNVGGVRVQHNRPAWMAGRHFGPSQANWRELKVCVCVCVCVWPLCGLQVLIGGQSDSIHWQFSTQVRRTVQMHGAWAQRWRHHQWRQARGSRSDRVSSSYSTCCLAC